MLKKKCLTFLMILLLLLGSTDIFLPIPAGRINPLVATFSFSMDQSHVGGVMDHLNGMRVCNNIYCM